jgi:hypothetical protein
LGVLAVSPQALLDHCAGKLSLAAANRLPADVEVVRCAVASPTLVDGPTTLLLVVRSAFFAPVEAGGEIPRLPNPVLQPVVLEPSTTRSAEYEAAWPAAWAQVREQLPPETPAEQVAATETLVRQWSQGAYVAAGSAYAQACETCADMLEGVLKAGGDRHCSAQAQELLGKLAATMRSLGKDEVRA